MGIGTSMGAYYDDEFHQAVAQWNPKYDLNEVHPEDVQNYRTNSPKIEQVSDVYSVSPMIDTENGVIPLSGGAVARKAPETVGKAALRNDVGEIFEGKTHGHAFEKYIAKYPNETNFGNVDQGFTTSKGRFVNREEAFQIAKERDQFVDKGILPMDAFGLLSEDLK